MQRRIGFGPVVPARYRAAGSRRRLVLWLPLVGVGALLYWTTALGLGELSLALVGPSEDELELVPAPLADSWASAGAASLEEPIVVQLQSLTDDPTTTALPDQATSAGEAGRGGVDEKAAANPSTPGRTTF